VPEHPDRDAAVPCELPDAEHDVSGLQPHTVSGSTFSRLAPGVVTPGGRIPLAHGERRQERRPRRENVPCHVTLAPVLRPRDVAAGPNPWLRPAAVLSPAAALASLVTGCCPAQPRQSHIAVVNPGGRGGLARERVRTAGCPGRGARSRAGRLDLVRHMSAAGRLCGEVRRARANEGKFCPVISLYPSGWYFRASALAPNWYAGRSRGPQS
jgi:hypothetical protein